MNMPTEEDFRIAIINEFAEARNQGLSKICIKSGALHRKLGGYPGTNHRMRTCCNCMRKFIKPEDKILHQPPKGNGANLIICFNL